MILVKSTSLLTAWALSRFRSVVFSLKIDPQFTTMIAGVLIYRVSIHIRLEMHKWMNERQVTP